LKSETNAQDMMKLRQIRFGAGTSGLIDTSHAAKVRIVLSMS